MIREDYIMRQMQQFMRIMAQVIFRKQNEEYKEALAEIQHSGQLFLGLDLNAVHTLTFDALQEALRVKNGQDARHVSLLAELLYHQGDCFAHEQAPDAAHRSYALALDLYLDLFTSGAGVQLPDLSPRIDALLDHFDLLVLAPETQRMVFRYFDAVGRYADAEDVLFHLADLHPSAELYHDGVAFFERLLRTSYKYLRAGNLPYEEVKEGLAAFRRTFEALS